jgi:predicted Fe-Mo cluster-binding NifX family protein
LDSPVYGHFGSAPGFVIVNAEHAPAEFEEFANNDLHHSHGMCQPLKALGGREVDAIVVGGIGMGALTKLHARGVLVYRAMEGSVGENLAFIVGGKLPRLGVEHTCAGHAGGCEHH